MNYFSWKKNYYLVTNKKLTDLANQYGIDPSISRNKCKANLQIINDLIKQNPNESIYYSIIVTPWTKGDVITFKVYMKDLLASNQYICIDADIYLSLFFPSATTNYRENATTTNFNPEYLKFVNDLANELPILSGNDWQADAIWPYADPAKFDTLNCLYSSQYPEWTGKPISKCFIPGSTIDIPTTIYAVMVDLFFNYPSLTP
jgi:hypothetical protein